ncbi:MAG: ATP phosphoribosyltransferase [Actinobacteria bacterium]|nr:ATP phosphoribosyltransferase [Actinomycetota bacterium]
MSLRIALAAGTPLAETLDLFAAAGVPVAPLRQVGASPLQELPDGTVVLATRAADVPLFVERGGADIGVVGKEILVEVERDVYELLDLRVGRARLVFAQPEDASGAWDEEHGPSRVRVATRFPETTRRYFEASGRQVNVLALEGPVEAAPRLRLADGVVDLVRSGETLRRAGLTEREQIAECSLRLIAGRAAHALRAAEIGALIGRLRELTERSESGGEA